MGKIFSHWRLDPVYLCLNDCGLNTVVISIVPDKRRYLHNNFPYFSMKTWVLIRSALVSEVLLFSGTT